MKKLSTLIILFTLSLTAYGQSLTENQIYGNWQVNEVVEKPTNPQFESLVDGFKNATFSFTENKNFNLTTTSKSKLFGMITEMTQNTKWKYEPNQHLIRIGNEEDGYSIMGIIVKQTSKNLLFHLEESGIILKVNKSE